MESRHAVPEAESDPGPATLCDLAPQCPHNSFDPRPADLGAGWLLEDDLERLALGSIHPR